MQVISWSRGSKTQTQATNYPAYFIIIKLFIFNYLKYLNFIINKIASET
ncbi:MAG: hypothetical protein Tsb0015_08910 [Simkaniaceae bacterium]